MNATVKVSKGSHLNIRSAGSTLSRIVGKAPADAVLQVVKQGEKWSQIKYGAIAGYVANDYIKIMPEATPAPTKRQRVAVLDPGHFLNHNKGAAAGYYEGNWNLAYAFMLQAALMELGWKVILTRTTGADIASLTARGKVAVKNKADLLYSIHSNACATPSVRRVTCFRSVDRPNDEAFAKAQAKCVASVMGSPSYTAAVRPSTTNHSKPDPSTDEDYYTVIDAASDGGVPHVILLEHDFHTNAAVCNWLSAPGSRAGSWAINMDHCKALARAEAANVNSFIVV